MKTHPHRFKIAATSALLTCAMAFSIQAQTFDYDFSTAAQFTDNFTGTLNPANVNWNAAKDVRLAGSSLGSGGIITTNASTFLTQTISGNLTLSSSVGEGWSFGVFTRVQADNTGVLALINFRNASDAIRLRLFSGALVNGTGAGTNFHDSNLTGLSNPPDLGSLSFELTQTSALDPVFNLTLTDAQGLVASTGNIALTTTDAYNGAGNVAFRFFSAPSTNTETQYLALNSVTAIPEPSSYALMGLFLGVAGLVTRKMRQARRA